MENQISDTQLVSSSTSSSAGRSTKHLKAPTGAKSTVWKYFGLEAGVMVSKRKYFEFEAGVIVSKRVKCILCKYIIFHGNTKIKNGEKALLEIL